MSSVRLLNTELRGIIRMCAITWRSAGHTCGRPHRVAPTPEFPFIRLSRAWRNSSWNRFSPGGRTHGAAPTLTEMGVNCFVCWCCSSCGRARGGQGGLCSDVRGGGDEMWTRSFSIALKVLRDDLKLRGIDRSGSFCSGEDREKSTTIQVNVSDLCAVFQCTHHPPRARSTIAQEYGSGSADQGQSEQ